METLDYDYTVHQRPGAGDDKLFAMFHPGVTPDSERTEAEGRPIFKDEVYIRIITPGDRNNIIDRPMRPEDKFRFAKQYAAFQSGNTEGGIGTPLQEWSPMPRSLVEELRYFGFRTVEHVAEAQDSVLGKMPGLREWQKRAQIFLAASKESAGQSQFLATETRLQSEIDSLRDQLTQVLKVAKFPAGTQDVAEAAKAKVAEQAGS